MFLQKSNKQNKSNNPTGGIAVSKYVCMKDLPIFSSLSIAEKNRIGELAGKRLYTKGEFIFHEGETADCIYLIKYGRVKLTKVSPAGKEIILGMLGENDFFGENTFFDQSVHTLSAQSLDNTYICSCGRDAFLELLQNPDTSLKIIRLLSEKLNSYSEQVASIAFLDVKGRVSSALMRLANDYGINENGSMAIDIDLTHNEIAGLVNASRVMVSNVISSLRQDGLISTKGHRFYLHSPEKMSCVNEKITKFV